VIGQRFTEGMIVARPALIQMLASIMKALGVAGLCTVVAQAAAGENFTFSLCEGWHLQSSAKVVAAGEALSEIGCDTTGWVPAKVPNTVLGVLVDRGVYGDPFMGRNLERIPAADFQVAWWYRTEFEVPAAPGRDHARLCLDGVNYRAEVWLNGRKIAGQAQIVGAFRRHEIDVTALLRTGRNALAVEVFPPQPGDYTVGFVDWNPVPPDRNMGLFRGVRLVRSGSVSLSDPFVRTDVNLETLDEAKLSVEAELVNHTDRAQSGTLIGELESIHFKAPFALAPRERKLVRVSPAEVPALVVRNPRLWWPLHYGDPNLHRLTLRAVAEGRPSDERKVTFGIRAVGDYLTPEGHRGYTVNGKKILIRGGGWVDDIFLREDPAQLEDQFDYVRAMNLNTVRLEGFWGASERLYELADEKGILLMAGWSCQWEWPEYLGVPIVEHDTFGGPKTPADVDLVTAYLRDHVRWLRNHPSVLVWVLGSDKLPWPEVEQRYRADLARIDPSRPLLAACKQHPSPVSGPTGVKMAGPYQYVTPNYWFEDRRYGGAFGFNTETGPGPQIPPLASLRRMLPADQLWPVNETWNYHCGRFAFGDLKVYLDAFTARYGGADSVEELAFKAQAVNYEAMRAMFEAFGAARPRTTGIIQWMLNAPWPKLYWQLYGHDLMPNGAFYGAKKGSSPRHAAFDPVTRRVVAVNDTLVDLAGARLAAQVLDADSRVVFAREVDVNCPATSARPVLDLPALDPRMPIHFLSLKLRDAGGRLLSDNFHWLSARPDVLDYGKTTWFGTPLQSAADFTALNRLPPADVVMTARFTPGEATVSLTNRSDHVAFFNELQLQRSDTNVPVLPVLWDDNYVSLLPRETRTLKARFRPADAGGETLEVLLQGWNLNPPSGRN
jgi:exo-1,4-beta-D-glucosaminidase